MPKQTKLLGSSATTPVDDKVRRVVVLPGKPSKDFILDAKCLIVVVGGRISMSAMDLPGDSGGIYSWNTTSTKIRLVNKQGNVLVAEALDLPSNSRGDEKVIVTRTAPDGTTRTKTVALTVARVVFGPASQQNYGYDDFDSPATQSDHHVSVRSASETMIKVTVEGGVFGNDFDFVCEDPTICIAEAAPAKAEFNLSIKANTWQRKSSVLRAIVKCPSAAVFAQINLHVYTENVIRVLVAKVVDLRSPSTALRYPAADYAAHQKKANEKLKEAVVKCELVNFDERNGVTDVAFDSNVSGALAFDINAGGGEAFKLIDQSIKQRAPGQHRVVIVRNMRSFYYLSRKARKGDTAIFVRGENVFKATMPLGSGPNAESVDVIRTDGNLAHLATPLKFDHAIGEPLEFPAAGWSSDPIIIAEGATPDFVIKWTVLHEVGHSGLELQDVIDPADLMHFDQDITDARLRFCPRDSQYSPGEKENQWETVPRPSPGRFLTK